MPDPVSISLQSFRDVAKSSFFGSRDIILTGDKASVKLGNLVFSSGKELNAATMQAFKEALESKYGVFGTHAFDTVVGTRQQLGLSLRAADVKDTLSALHGVKKQRFAGELKRQLDTSPKIRELSQAVRTELRRITGRHPLGNPPVDLRHCKNPAQMAKLVADTLDAAIVTARANIAAANGDTAEVTLGKRHHREKGIGPDTPTGLLGLRRLKVDFSTRATSVEDRVKSGKLGAGMRINRSTRNPVLFEKLKTNGVEPGFISRNDWSVDDTRGLMADLWSDKNLAALNRLVRHNPALAAKRNAHPPASMRELAMLAGRAHPAGIAAVAEFILQRELGKAQSPIAKAFREKFPGVNPATLFPADGNAAPQSPQREIIAQAKRELFVQIRDAVMNEPADSADYGKSPVFKHFAERSIVKLDYNEGDRRGIHFHGSTGKFRLPERVGIKGGPIKGFFYRNIRLTTADKASAGAVREALANDITRLLGVPAQELSLVRGQYSDGHPKLMLSAKFAEGYHDLEDGFLKDGQAVPGEDGEPLEALGKYKALFLALADRDAVGSHGQNKGVRNGRFFAIDPGHSLEGNGPDLEIHDDLSFVDKGASRFEKRFLNFSVFDDDTRFNKFQGILKLREISTSPRLEQLFASYEAEFNPNEPGIGEDEKKLRLAIIADIGRMKAEFRAQIGTMLGVFRGQLDFYDALGPQGAAVQERGIETIANLEKLTSPTTWTSPSGEVELRHLAVRPETRVPWQGGLQPNGALAYWTNGPLDAEAKTRLADMCSHTGATCSFDDQGGAHIAMPMDRSAIFFDALAEDNIAALKHPDEHFVRNFTMIDM